jgi:hypothetical protein
MRSSWILIGLLVLIAGQAGCRAPEDVILVAATVSADASYQVNIIDLTYPMPTTAPALVQQNRRAFKNIVASQENVNAYLQHRAADANKAGGR